jgi:alkanesulfonate monooxygenase SsuD/methylene tetrahydromethanopterin reductase-like flavin-dependent oxidoreductase (luciferase family)
LNVARCPQGYPVLFMAGQSELGLEFAAKTADCLFAVTDTKERGQEVYADVKGRLAKYGRTPDQLRLMPGCTVYVGRTAAEANELYEELQALISPEVGVPNLSKLVEHKLEGLSLDGPMPDLSMEVNAISSFRKSISAAAQREKLTIRQTYERVLPSMGHIVFKGSASQVADEMADWYTSKACDGFNVQVPVLPRGLTAFVDLVVPALQKRGLFRTEYQGNTLREIMGLPTPRNPYFDR